MSAEEGQAFLSHESQAGMKNRPQERARPDGRPKTGAGLFPLGGPARRGDAGHAWKHGGARA